MNSNEQILNLLTKVPRKPGVYLWKNAQGEVIYIGKAVNLYNRMHQYFKGAINSYKTHAMVSNIASFDFIVTENNKSAFVLEKNYIEQYKPKYNVQLLDDKRYPYLKIKLTDKLEISSTFRIGQADKNNYYYGPFPPGENIRGLIKVLQRIFLYENGLPIINKSRSYWEEKFHELILLLKLKDNSFLDHLYSKMQKASDSMNFELALEYKKAYLVLKNMKDIQISEISVFKNIDVISIIEQDDYLLFYVIMYRYGVQINHFFHVSEAIGVKEQIIENFIFSLYHSKNEIPDKLVLDEKYKDIFLDENLTSKVVFPKIGILHKLLERALINNKEMANVHLENLKSKKEQKDLLWSEVIEFLGSKVESNPTIYLFDNSNLNNNFPVGVTVAFQNGEPNKMLYRKFNHEKTVTKDSRKSDVEYMYQTIYKYFESNWKFLKDDDIFIVDGAIMQINEALRAIKNLGINRKIKLYSLVKNDYHKTSKLLDSSGDEIAIKNRNIFNFLARMQVEVDRFAKTYLRKKHINSTFESKLTQIKGIGKKTEQILLKTFQNYSNIANASFEEIEKVTNKKIAKIIKENYKL
ncbi:excinuclease ABC subunit UvrC [Mycoplasmopsis gallinacea]|uniref:Excinuclease cho n=1 Tax=Mycoplasmopsis gallinacea TaxID=29556 RepID=A0A6H0V2S0_9BACT|nr:excinuclease ABC subunit UvrC [Mycoplasmopsis gallinacea]QIW62278.1 excinuclease ABC subunit C [Mycoplasmopsis gallinacea]